MLFCSIRYCTYYQIYNSLLHACNTRIHMHERAGLWRVSEAATGMYMRTGVYVISACASYVEYKNDIKMCAYYELCALSLLIRLYGTLFMHNLLGFCVEVIHMKTKHKLPADQYNVGRSYCKPDPTVLTINVTACSCFASRGKWQVSTLLC